MIGIIIASIIVIWGWSGLSKSQWKFICAAICLITNIFGLNIPETSIKYSDFFILLFTYPLLFHVKWGQVISNLRTDKIGKVIFFINIYFFTTFIWTIFIGEESFTYAFKVYRTILFFWSYFYLRNIKYEQYKKAFKVLFYITIILGFLFLLQILNINLLAGSTEFNISSGGISRMRNIPQTTILFIFSLLFIKMNLRNKIFFLLMWICILVLSQHRGIILSISFVIPFLYLIRGSFGKILQFIIIGSILILLFSPVLMQRFETKRNEMSITDEIEKGLNFSKVNYDDIQDDATFLFRTFLIKERVEYMMEHPINLFFGFGMLHEDSPSTAHKFHFLIGSAKKDSSTGEFSLQQQIDTNDVALISILMRTGLIYLFLFINLCVLFYKQFIRNINIASNFGFLLLTFCIMRIFSGDEFTAFNYVCLFIFTICSSYISKNELNGKNISCSSNL